jgi:hypothetical protein
VRCGWLLLQGDDVAVALAVGRVAGKDELGLGRLGRQADREGDRALRVGGAGADRDPLLVLPGAAFQGDRLTRDGLAAGVEDAGDRVGPTAAAEPALVGLLELRAWVSFG